MRWTRTRLLLSSRARMALYHQPPSEKLIFAPAGHDAHGQAAQFTRGKLNRSDLDTTSPIPQFHSWFAQAQATEGIAQPEACTLSTAELPSGRVSSRLVYLKELDAQGFVIYTNLGTSRKAADLATNPHAALVFYWAALQRQVRIEGRTTRHSREESQAYFDTRVRGSRIGAWASKQSVVLAPKSPAATTNLQNGHRSDGVKPSPPSPPTEKGAEEGHHQHDDDGREQLEEWVAEAEARFKDHEQIPVPEFWGGLRIIPDRVEFWQGRESRLHDRFAYEWEEVDETETNGAPLEVHEGKKGRWRLDRLSP